MKNKRENKTKPIDNKNKNRLYILYIAKRKISRVMQLKEYIVVVLAAPDTMAE